MSPRLREIITQEQDKSALVRWMEYLFLFRPSPRQYERYTEKRFNPLTGRME